MTSMLASIALVAAVAVAAPLPAPADWVPVRWATNEARSLELLRGTPVNCVVLEPELWNGAFIKAARESGIVAVGVIRVGQNQKNEGQRAAEMGFAGVAIEGELAAPTVFDPKLTVIPMGLRTSMRFDSPAGTVMGSNQGLWPGVRAEQEGTAHAAASGSVWIETNAGYLRYARAATDATLWVGVRPPANNVYPVERYLAAIADAAMMGARWVIALDADFEKRLLAREAKALDGWRRIGSELAFYEAHAEWRGYRSYGKLAIVESPQTGALLSGGVLDMIGTKHTPVIAVPPAKVTPKAFEGALMAVDIDPAALSDAQREALRGFARAGGTLLTGPPGWRFPALKPEQVTLNKEDTEKLDLIWKELNSMTGRRNLGARLFNVSTLLSNFVSSPDGGTRVLHLVNYADYPVENVSVQLLGKYKRALLYRPEVAQPVVLELYPTEEGVGVDIEKLGSAGAVVLVPDQSN